MSKKWTRQPSKTGWNWFFGDTGNGIKELNMAYVQEDSIFLQSSGTVVDCNEIKDGFYMDIDEPELPKEE